MTVLFVLMTVLLRVQLIDERIVGPTFWLSSQFCGLSSLTAVEWHVSEMKGPDPWKFGTGLKRLIAIEIFAPILSKLLSIAVICTN